MWLILKEQSLLLVVWFLRVLPVSWWGGRCYGVIRSLCGPVWSFFTPLHGLAVTPSCLFPGLALPRKEKPVLVFFSLFRTSLVRACEWKENGLLVAINRPLWARRVALAEAVNRRGFEVVSSSRARPPGCDFALHSLHFRQDDPDRRRWGRAQRSARAFIQGLFSSSLFFLSALLRARPPEFLLLRCSFSVVTRRPAFRYGCSGGHDPVSCC